MVLSTEITSRERVLDIRDRLPSIPAIRIAEMLSISRERVRQILKEEGLPTQIPRHYGWCLLCEEAIPATRKDYCSADCRREATRITFTCDFCGINKTILRCIYNAQKKRGYKNMYCSRDCRNHGTWDSYKEINKK